MRNWRRSLPLFNDKSGYVDTDCPAPKFSQPAYECRYAVMGNDGLPLLPKSGLGSAPEELLLQEDPSEKQEGFSTVTESIALPLAPAEKQAMKWFSGLGSDAKNLSKGQGPMTCQADIQSSILAYASLSSGR